MAGGGGAVTRLEQSLADYLQLRRSLGHQLDDAGRLVPGFVAFLDDRGLSTVTIAAAMEWAALPVADPRSTVGPRRMTAVRGFARYLAGVDPATEVPPLGLMPQQTRWRGSFVFSPADIGLIMNRVGDFTPPLRSATYITLIGLLAATGLRIGEAIKLDRADIDWSTGLLLIRESKFGKSRLVPVTDTTLQALSDYARLRDQLQPRVRQPSFFTPAPSTGCATPSSLRRSALSSTPAVSEPTRRGGPGCTTSDTSSQSGPCWVGTDPVRMCRPKFRRCRPTSVTANRARPTGTCPRSPSCWPAPPPAKDWLRR